MIEPLFSVCVCVCVCFRFIGKEESAPLGLRMRKNIPFVHCFSLFAFRLFFNNPLISIDRSSIYLSIFRSNHLDLASRFQGVVAVVAIVVVVVVVVVVALCRPLFDRGLIATSSKKKPKKTGTNNKRNDSTQCGSPPRALIFASVGGRGRSKEKGRRFSFVFKVSEELHAIGNLHVTRVSAELKMARSLVRVADIQATLQEQRSVLKLKPLKKKTR